MVKPNLFNVVNELERLKGRKLSSNEIAQRASLSRHTINNLIQGNTKLVHFETLTKLLAFFRAEGMDVNLADLLTEQ